MTDLHCKVRVLCFVKMLEQFVPLSSPEVSVARVTAVHLQVEQEGEVAIVKRATGETDEAAVVVYQRDQDTRNELVVEGVLGKMYYEVREQVYQHCRLVPN